MKVFEIDIDGKKYEYITSKQVEGINYVAYADSNNIYIAKYSIVNNQIKLTPITDDLIPKLKEELGLV